MFNLNFRETTVLQKFVEQDWDLNLLIEEMRYDIEQKELGSILNILIGKGLIEKDPDEYKNLTYKISLKAKKALSDINKQAIQAALKEQIQIDRKNYKELLDIEKVERDIEKLKYEESIRGLEIKLKKATLQNSRLQALNVIFGGVGAVSGLLAEYHCGLINQISKLLEIWHK